MRNRISERLEQSEQGRKLLAQERLILDVTESICDTMELQSVTRSDLAKRMSTSQPYITKLLRGTQNLTLRTLADVAFVLERDVVVAFLPAASAQSAGHLEAAGGDPETPSGMQAIGWHSWSEVLDHVDGSPHPGHNLKPQCHDEALAA